MNRKLYIYLSILVAVVLMASCSSHKEKKESVAQKDSLASSDAGRFKEVAGDKTTQSWSNEKEADPMEVLSADTLSRVEQDAMGKRARQKLDDYYNYQEIINDPQYDTALRNHARSLAKDMLVSDMSVQPQNNPNTVSNPGSSSGTYAVHVTDCNGCSSTTVSGLIFSEKDSTYSGILPGIDKRADLVSGNPPTGFVVRKVSKRFGNKRVRVWEVFLR